MQYKKLLYLSLLAFVAGCQGMMPLEGAAPVNPGGDVTLTFKRTSTVFFGLVKSAQVYVDDLKVCVIPNAGNCTVNIPSGKHILKVDGTMSGSFGIFSQTYQFDSGKTYRFIISPNRSEMILEDPTGPVGFIAAPTYYELNKTANSSDNGEFTMKSID